MSLVLPTHLQLRDEGYSEINACQSLLSSHGGYSMPLSPPLYRAYNTERFDFDNQNHDYPSDKLKEADIKKTGSALIKLAKIVNEQNIFNSGFSFIPTVPAKTQLLFASVNFFNLGCRQQREHPTAESAIGCRAFRHGSSLCNLQCHPGQHI
ncbi:hypothetical protein ABK905_19870 [Acerihabitans sp. KWT182]|uniref:Uncharacterized protein n=1 Tax=Acerihabitans sp. KWT182 TaxID=3157919 RepID=A0AAU7Q6L6_9GAMM